MYGNYILDKRIAFGDKIKGGEMRHEKHGNIPSEFLEDFCMGGWNCRDRCSGSRSFQWRNND